LWFGLYFVSCFFLLGWSFSVVILFIALAWQHLEWSSKDCNLVPANICIHLYIFWSSVNFGLAARIAFTVVLFSFAIELRVSPLSTSTFIGLDGLGLEDFLALCDS
jgi:hypothetical protein